MTEVHLVAASADRLGEGPVWAAAEARLYWFDIKGRRLNWHAPARDETGGYDLPCRASAAAVRAGGGLLLATEAGLAEIDPASGAVRMRQAFDFGDGFRSNDGNVDPMGRFWWTTMDDNHGERPGEIFRTDPGGATERLLGGIQIPNTVAFSPDGATFYLADSRRQTMFAYETADLSKVREFAHTRGQGATPDGSAVDAEGYLWNAQWGGGRVVRYDPNGQIDRIVALPVRQTSSCAFGGPDLTTLYVTSAWDGLSAAEREAQPLAGGLFAFEPGVRGLPIPTFQG